MNAPLTLKTTPTIDCSPEEWEARVDLACLYRIVSHLGWHKSIIYNHISMRVPGPETHFLLNPINIAPQWMPNLPLACEGNIGVTYGDTH